MRFTGPRTVDAVMLPSPDLAPGEVRVRTIASGISAGTEMTAYRGTNPYLTSSWDPDLRLFDGAHPDTPSYPLEGWGYSEVGEVIEMADASEGSTPDVAVGDVVWGIWGHRSEAVLPAAALRGHILPPGQDPRVGCFVRVAAIALNAVIAARAGIGDTVVVFGQGVIGLLATHFAKMSGCRVIAVEGLAPRRALAAQVADLVLEPSAETAPRVRALTGGHGADVAIELSGSYHALREALRVVGPDSTVIAAGFYQGPATALALGEEFHHNRVSLVASQIGAVPSFLHPRWDRDRLQKVVIGLLTTGRPDVLPLISHTFPLAEAAAAYHLLDSSPEATMQVLLDFP